MCISQKLKILCSSIRKKNKPIACTNQQITNMLHITLQHHFYNKCQCVCCASSLRDCVHYFVSMCVCLHRVSLLRVVFVCIFYALFLTLSLSPPHSTGSRDVRSRYVCVCVSFSRNSQHAPAHRGNVCVLTLLCRSLYCFSVRTHTHTHSVGAHRFKVHARLCHTPQPLLPYKVKRSLGLLLCVLFFKILFFLFFIDAIEELKELKCMPTFYVLIFFIVFDVIDRQRKRST